MVRMFCRPQNHDYDTVIKMVIMSYASVARGRSDVSFLAVFNFVFYGYIAFVL